MEMRMALLAVRSPSAGCDASKLRVQSVSGLTIHLGIGSTFEAAGAADRIFQQIGELYHEGEFTAIMVRYGQYGLTDNRAAHELIEAEEREKRFALIITGLLALLGFLPIYELFLTPR